MNRSIDIVSDGRVWEAVWMDAAAIAAGPPDMAETAERAA